MEMHTAFLKNIIDLIGNDNLEEANPASEYDTFMLEVRQYQHNQMSTTAQSYKTKFVFITRY
jgi:hypothetical protein